jgi:nucleoside phosphorylase
MNDTPAVDHAASDPVPGGVLVLTALDLEYEAVRAHLSDLREHAHPAGTLFETGWLPGGRQVTIAVTGEGNQGAAVLAERGIAMFRPRAVMFVGVAGALKDDISLGDVDDTLSSADLTSHVRDVAEELAARLLAGFREGNR